MARLPLEGIRIIDNGAAFAGPYGGMVLGDLGAEVIKVESTQVIPNSTRKCFFVRPPREMYRQMSVSTGRYCDDDPGERPWNRFSWFNSVSRNKLSMTVDLTRPNGMEIFKKLVKISDAIIDNNAPESADKLGITYEMLKEAKPDIIWVRIPSFGLTGPYRDFRGMGLQVEAIAGHDSLRHYRGTDVSTNTWMVPSDYAGGLAGALALMMALHYRERTGKGQVVDCSMVENFLGLVGNIVMDYTMNGRVQESIGNRDYTAVQGPYRCKGDDRWVNITIASDEEWSGFCRALGNPAWTGDEKFRDQVSRLRNQDDLDKLIEEWTQQRENYEVMQALQAEGVAAGPIIDQADAFRDPHIKAREFFVEMTHPDCGTHLYPGMGCKMGRTPLAARRVAPTLGQDNEYIYKQLLKVSDAEYDMLVKEGHIGTEPAPHLR